MMFMVPMQLSWKCTIDMMALCSGIAFNNYIWEPAVGDQEATWSCKDAMFIPAKESSQSHMVPASLKLDHSRLSSGK